MPLDLTALRNPTAQLEDALRYARGDLARGDRVRRACARPAELGADLDVRVARRGSARRASDLDLAIDAGRRIEPGEAVALAEAFDACDLPYAVDIVDLWSVGEGFADLIKANRVPLPNLDHAP